MRSHALGLALALSVACPTSLAAAQDSDSDSGASSSSGRSSSSGNSRVYIDRPHRGSRPFQLDVHGGFAWWGLGLASGVRFGIPLVENGFVESINNAVYLNFGVDFYWIRWRCRNMGCQDWDYNVGFGFPITLHWEFYFTDNWSAFAEIGGQLFIHPRWISDGSFEWREPGAWFVWTIGGSFHVNEWFLLTLRVGSPYISFGITFQLG